MPPTCDISDGLCANELASGQEGEDISARIRLRRRMYLPDPFGCSEFS